MAADFSGWSGGGETAVWEVGREAAVGGATAAGGKAGVSAGAMTTETVPSAAGWLVFPSPDAGAVAGGEGTFAGTAGGAAGLAGLLGAAGWAGGKGGAAGGSTAG
ncbi:MAG: hypothetical protein EBU59_08675 [Planctomycetia bacterium]|nr:hypothetical protein [Planctomycetia bacterium]